MATTYETASGELLSLQGGPTPGSGCISDLLGDAKILVQDVDDGGAGRSDLIADSFDFEGFSFVRLHDSARRVHDTSLRLATTSK
jgi:hypothetical protein